ncbi:transmembrane protein 208 [Ptiloglossa arizonensis]|uniref:transmembrane protein 208 n=1 Tax=Ptiloglossa arizonensis TaxID=3350558 RepID=UPI003FA13F2A
MVTKKTKVATRGVKQIVEENRTTLSFYRNMIIGVLGIYFSIMMLFFEFTTSSIDKQRIQKLDNCWMVALILTWKVV